MWLPILLSYYKKVRILNKQQLRTSGNRPNMSAPQSQVAPRETSQKQIQQDWANREYIEVITVSIKKITDFLNSFDLSCRSKLAVLNEKLTTLERKIDYLEACVTKGETLT